MGEILCWNETGCLALAAPAKRCKCMKLDLGFKEANTESFARKGFANLEQNRPPYEDGLLVRSPSDDQIS